MSKSRKPSLATKVDTVKTNIRRLNTEISSSKRLRSPSTIRGVTPWYAARIFRSWKFGFSKYIGYDGMTAKKYESILRTEKRNGKTIIEGGSTNSRLRPMSVASSEQTRHHRDIVNCLKKFHNTTLELEHLYSDDIRVLAQPLDNKAVRKIASELDLENVEVDFSGWTGLQNKEYGLLLRVGTATPTDGPWYLAHNSEELFDVLRIKPTELISGTRSSNRVEYVSPNELTSGRKLLAAHYSFNSFRALQDAIRQVARAKGFKAKRPQNRRSPQSGEKSGSSSDNLRADVNRNEEIRKESERIEGMFDEDCNDQNGKLKRKFVAIRNRNRRAVDDLKKLYKKCQITGKKFAFRKRDNERYLEVHHIKPLSEEGADHPYNMIVISAHIHRMIHYGNMEEINLRDIENEKLSFRLNNKEYTITWDKRHAAEVERHTKSKRSK